MGQSFQITPARGQKTPYYFKKLISAANPTISNKTTGESEIFINLTKEQRLKKVEAIRRLDKLCPGRYYAFTRNDSFLLNDQFEWLSRISRDIMPLQLFCSPNRRLTE
jgi:hypothetical protein